MLEKNEEAYEFWQTKLNAAKLIVAPMVDQSELAWRLLSRRHGAQLCYTPMFHAPVFVRDERYRKDSLVTCEEDRPLIVQFCANDPQILLEASKKAEAFCDAIDLNIGCPQAIAKRGHYGAFLQDDWELLDKMIQLCAKELKVPITAKIRIYEDIEKTVRYAQMLEKAGCKILTVHGRTKEQKGPMTGIASWKHIKAVRENVKIPVFANGNIQYLADVEKCIEEVGVDGVMSAEGNLHNPALFEGIQPPVWDIATEYLDLVKQYPCPLSYVRGHLFKIFQHPLQIHFEVRDKLAVSGSVQEMYECVEMLKSASQTDVAVYEKDPSTYQSSLPYPYWLCQPYVRPSPISQEELKERSEKSTKRPLECVIGENGVPLSKNKLKKRKRNPNKSFVSKGEKYVRCSQCSNIKGNRCIFELCKSCCKERCRTELADCIGHKLLFKTKHKQNSEKTEIGDTSKNDSSSAICEGLNTKECTENYGDNSRKGENNVKSKDIDTKKSSNENS